MDKQIISKERVANRGEVFTNKHEVNAMLDLVKHEADRIESRFLVPACGQGNFLVEILERKLGIVESRYKKCQLDYERNAILAVSSIYGIEILKDNVLECRKRLFNIFDHTYSKLFKKSKDNCRRAAQHILDKNIVWGDALTLKTVGENPQPIVFSEWSPVNGILFKRRDFVFLELFPKKIEKNASLFSRPEKVLYSDLGGEVFIPTPVKDYPLIHFMRIFDVK